MSISVKTAENTKILSTISIGYRGYTIVLHVDPDTYSFCQIYDPNLAVLGNMKFACDISGINRAQRVIDAVLD